MSGGDLLPLPLVMQISQMQMRQKQKNFLSKKMVFPDVCCRKNYILFVRNKNILLIHLSYGENQA